MSQGSDFVFGKAVVVVALLAVADVGAFDVAFLARTRKRGENGPDKHVQTLELAPCRNGTMMRM